MLAHNRRHFPKATALLSDMLCLGMGANRRVSGSFKKRRVIRLEMLLLVKTNVTIQNSLTSKNSFTEPEMEIPISFGLDESSEDDYLEERW